MNSLEKKLVEAAGKGKWAKFHDSVPTTGQPDVTIQASFIRDLLLGIQDPRIQPRIRSVCIHGAIIDGTLDLSDCAGTDGEPLPPLLLHSCLLLGESNEPTRLALDARHARLSRLSLKGCRIGHVNLSDATLDGDLEIDEIHPIDQERICQISARQCRIDGSVYARSAKLKIEDGQVNSDFDTPDYALNLAEAEIKGSIVLQPDFVAEGGVNVSGARVSGDIWAEGATLKASKHIAFRAQSLQCEGTVALRGSKNGKSRPCEVKGQVTFLDATVGFLDMCGAHIAEPSQWPENRGEQWALVLSLLRVRDHLLLQERSSFRTIVEGPIHSDSCRVNGHFYLHDIDIRMPTQFTGRTAFQATNLQVGGDLYISDMTSDISINGSHIAHNLTLTRTGRTKNQDYSVSARNVEIGNDCTLNSVSGIVDLELARIGGALKVDADWLASLNAKDAEVRGSVSLSGSFKNWIEGHQDYGSSELKTLRFDGGSYGEIGVDIEFRQLGERIPALSIEDAKIERDLSIISISAAKSDKVLREILTRVADEPPPDRALVFNLTFYKDWKLEEALYTLADERSGIVSFLVGQNGEKVLLSGRSNPIHLLNYRGHLKLDSEQAVLDYLRFFCSYVWGEEGAFTIIEDSRMLGEARPSKAFEPSPATVEADPDKGWLCKATVRYGNGLYGAKFRVLPSGKVDMLEDKALTKLEGFSPVTFVHPVRVLPAQSAGADSTATFPLWNSLNPHVGSDIASPADAKSFTDKLRPAIEAELASRKNGSAKILLRGLKAGALRFESSDSLSDGLQLHLEGFEYDRIEFPDSKKDDFQKEAQGVKARRWWSARSHRNRTQKKDEWLRLQYTNSEPKDDEYTPQPYEQLARVLRNSGHSEEAKGVVLEKLKLERQLIHPWWSKPAYWLMETCFQYGLFARRSVLWFLLLWFGGAALFDLAYHGRIHLPSWPKLRSPVMVIDSLPVNAIGPLGTIQNPNLIPPVSEAKAPAESPCVGEIDSLWYALDVFVPLLDLQQEERCTVSSSEDTWPWRAFKALYAVTGGIVTSMMLLSISGVLRRRVEQ